MDPVLMEAGDGAPLDLGRTLSKVGFEGGGGIGCVCMCMELRCSLLASSRHYVLSTKRQKTTKTPPFRPQVRAYTSRTPGAQDVPLPAALLAAVEAALASDAALAVTAQEEVRADYRGAGGEPMSREELRAAKERGRDLSQVI
jgi:hypothetical protein